MEFTHKSDKADLQIHEKKTTVMVKNGYLLHASYEIFV